MSEKIEADGGPIGEVADAEGALGYYWDDVSRSYVVVVPAGGTSTFDSVDAARFRAPVRIESRNVTRATIDEIAAALEALRPVISGSYGFYFDAELGKEVLQAETPVGDFDAVMSRFPGLIDHRPGRFNLTGWSNDTEPYDGGVWLNGPSHYCTSGVTVKTAANVRRLVTAGHCEQNGAVTNLGTVVRTAAFPDYDLEMIFGKTYSPGIYDSPITTRGVSTAGSPGIGQNYCTTGRSTGFVCTWIVRSRNVTICCLPQDYPGCAHGLAGFLPPTDQGTQYILGGDSGGPLWFKHANGTAGIRGVISGTWFAIATGRVFSYATMWGYIASELNVTAVLV